MGRITVSATQIVKICEALAAIAPATVSRNVDKSAHLPFEINRQWCSHYCLAEKIDTYCGSTSPDWTFSQGALRQRQKHLKTIIVLNVFFK